MTRNRKRKYTRRNKRKGGWGFSIISKKEINPNNDIEFGENENGVIYTENPLYEKKTEHQYIPIPSEYITDDTRNEFISELNFNVKYEWKMLNNKELNNLLYEKKRLTSESFNKLLNEYILTATKKQDRKNTQSRMDGRKPGFDIFKQPFASNMGGKTKRRRTRRINAKRLSSAK